MCRGVFIVRLQPEPKGCIFRTARLQISPWVSCRELHKSVLWLFSGRKCVSLHPGPRQNAYVLSTGLSAGTGYGRWLQSQQESALLGASLLTVRRELLRARRRWCKKLCFRLVIGDVPFCLPVCVRIRSRLLAADRWLGWVWIGDVR